MNIHESAEDYLEMIMMLREQKGYVRSVDIAAALSVTKPSVSHAMKQLRENGYITMDKDNFILLTVSGENIARSIYKRHRTLTHFLVLLGVDEKQARQKAEKLAIEDARFVLPNACETKMVVTMNARSLYNFFHHRCCNRAQWEIQALACEMLRLVKEAAPLLFATAGPKCLQGTCPEGKMSCGKAKEMRAFFLGGTNL